MESQGERLKRSRLEKGLTLEDVHKKTKIHLDVLKSLEEDSLINLDPIYARGFLKIYCKFLGLDINEFIKENKEKPPFLVKSGQSAYLSGTSSIKKDYSARIVSLAKRLPIGKIIVIVIVIALAAWVFSIGKNIAGKLRRSRRDSVSSSLTLAQKKSPSSKIKSQGPAGDVVRERRQSSSGVKLSIRAREDCWVQVAVDGRLLARNMLRKGKTETWQGKEKIEFSLSNAGAVYLEVNNKSIPSIGRKGQAVKNALVNKEGLISISK